MPVYAGMTPAQTRDALKRKLEPSYQGTFSGARRYVLHTFTHSQSALMRKRVSQFMRASACPLCAGKRLKREALTVTFAGLDIAELAQLPLLQLAEVLKPVASATYVEHGDEQGAVLTHAQTRDARQQRAARGDNAHAGGPDVRHTPNLSLENAWPRSASPRTCSNGWPP